MGRNHRHKKDLKAEKAKVKLKQSKTKFLPKGQNVTNTSFKIKPIVLPEQLKPKNLDDILSKTKLNVKDLLSRIRHYNESVRCNAAEELSDMIIIYTKEIVEQHLSSICLAISSLIQDREKKVRKAALKAIRTILKTVPNEKLIPFFDFFSTNLRCAMTNIDKNIQEDSLLFLDCFVETNCGLIPKSSEKILPDFLSLISKLRSDSQPGRTLTLNLGSKMTSVAWRIKVLSRLHAVLSLILEKEHRLNDFSEHAENTFRVSKRATFPIYKAGFAKVLEEPDLDIFSTAKNTSYHDSINRHILTLIPLLYETWLEVMPAQQVLKSVSEATTLNEETGALLTCIANTLHLLWRYVKNIDNEDINLKTVFMSLEGRKFLSNLLKNFPYCVAGARVKKSNGALKMFEHNRDVRCTHENLLICFLYLVLHIYCTQYNLKKDMVAINSYMNKLFFQKSPLNEESMQCLIELLTECFGENSHKWHKSGVDLNAILENSIVLYGNGKLLAQHKLSLFQVLSNIVNNAHLSRNDKYQSWMATLPNILCQPSVADTTVSALLELSKKNCGSFHAALVKKLPEIIRNLGELEISLTSDSLLQSKVAAYRNLASIFYYVPTYSQQDVQCFEDFINKSRSIFREYFKQMLILRSELGRS